MTTNGCSAGRPPIGVPELTAAVGSDLSESMQKNASAAVLKRCFKALMTCPQSKISSLLKQALTRMSKLGDTERSAQLAQLVERLYDQFPEDVGCFVIYFLNVISLQPNEAVYLPANEPHAYLSGDCVECMACSDNVIRAGLTPKFKDVETLCSMLNYEGESAQSKLFEPIVEDEFTQVYKPPVPDFALIKIQIPPGVHGYTLTKRTSASILLVINGTSTIETMSLIPGTAIFIPANCSFRLQDITHEFLAFQALANV